MRVNVVKRKAGSNRELSHAAYDIPDSGTLKELLYAVMTAELNSEPDVSSPGKIAYETHRKERYSAEQAWEILKQDFADGLFRVYFNRKEYTGLEQTLELGEENELVIVKLIMMAGRMW